MLTSSRNRNDCAITAISNLTGLSYEQVWQAREDCKVVAKNGGTITVGIHAICIKLGFRPVVDNGTNPASNMNCLFNFFYSPKGLTGHMVAVIDGVCIESNGVTWKPASKRLWRKACTYLYPIE